MWFVGGVSCKPMQRAGLVKRKVWRRWATTPVRAGGNVGSAQKKGGNTDSHSARIPLFDDWCCAWNTEYLSHTKGSL
jgi:hypothetical protein